MIHSETQDRSPLAGFGYLDAATIQALDIRVQDLSHPFTNSSICSSSMPHGKRKG